jgi:hypothetical protein
MYEDLWLSLAIFFGVIGFFFFVVVGACLWEKRPVQPYRVPEAGEEYELTSDAREANYQVRGLDYLPGGLCHDNKGKIYRVRYDFWLSPDHFILVVIGGGSIAGIPVNGIWVYSRLTDGRILCTTNEIGEQDISGAEEQQTWPKYDLISLIEKHRKRLTDSVEPFPAESPLAGYFDIRRRKADALVAKGYARYIDDEQSIWKYTLKGAIVFYFIGVWVRPIRRFLRLLRIVRE